MYMMLKGFMMAKSNHLMSIDFDQSRSPTPFKIEIILGLEGPICAFKPNNVMILVGLARLLSI